MTRFWVGLVLFPHIFAGVSRAAIASCGSPPSCARDPFSATCESPCFRCALPSFSSGGDGGDESDGNLLGAIPTGICAWKPTGGVPCATEAFGFFPGVSVVLDGSGSSPSCPAILSSFEASSLTSVPASASVAAAGLLATANATACASSVAWALRETTRGPCGALLRNLTGGESLITSSGSPSSSGEGDTQSSPPASSFSLPGFLGDATVAAACTSPCTVRLANAARVVAGSCFPSTDASGAAVDYGTSGDGSFSAVSAVSLSRAVERLLGALCKRNGAGRYCGAVLTPSGPDRGFLASLTATVFGAGRDGGEARRSLPQGLTCADFEPLLPEVNKMRDRLGCCFGEIFGALVDPGVLGGSAYGLVSDILGGLRTCGVEFSACAYRNASSGAPFMTGAMWATAPSAWITEATRPKKSHIDKALGVDIAAGFGVVPERVTITGVDFNATSTGANRTPVATQAKRTTIEVGFTVTANDEGSAGLRAIQAKNATVVLLNTDIVAGGDGGGDFVMGVGHPHIIKVDIGDEPLPAGSAASRIGAPWRIAMAVSTIVIALVGIF